MAPRIIYADLSEYQVSESGLDAPVVTDQPVGNLLDYNPAHMYVGSYLDNAQIKIDFGSARARSCCVIDTHNFDSLLPGEVILLEAADDAGFTSGAVEVIPDMSVSALAPTIFTFSPVTKRYWRIRFDGVAIEPPVLGQVFIEDVLSFRKTQSWGHKSGNTAHATIEKMSARGSIRTAQSWDARLVYDLAFKFLSDDFRAAFVQFIGAVQGRLLPFYFVPAGIDTPYLVLLQTDYTPVSAAKINLNDVQQARMATQRVRPDWYNLTINLAGPALGLGLYLTP